MKTDGKVIATVLGYKLATGQFAGHRTGTHVGIVVNGAVGRGNPTARLSS